MGLNSLSTMGLAANTAVMEQGAVETASGATYTYDASGYITQMVETLTGGNRTTTYTYNADRTINTEVSTYQGVTKTTTFVYTNGRITSYTVS